ncbi:MULTISPECIES: hypothetical protein [Thermococcus]|uniref:Uncharacterized protein n=1 Tax=Thermococcus waiotapuensis TaxID=90909 RepID=A0AAE4NX59_9EURY|nr:MULTISPECIES: hypothetical protein [Thermococcus]MDV3104325.1 hypothetical protein [Thermococcus waiotapuensis]
MNILIPLLIGFAVGRALLASESLRGMKLDSLLSATVLLLVFLMGIEAGKVEIAAGWLALSSILLAALTSAGSVLLGFLAWRWLK